MATNEKIVIIKGSSVLQVTNPTGATFLGYKNVNGAKQTIQVDFSNMTPLFGVSQTVGNSTTLAPSENAVKLVTDSKADKTKDGQNVVYGSIATAATDANDKLVNVGLLNTETAKINWHIRNIEESDFSLKGYWSASSGSALSTSDPTFMRTKKFRTKVGQRFKNTSYSGSPYLGVAVFFDKENKFLSSIAGADDPYGKEIIAPEGACFVAFSKASAAVDKNVYVTQDFWATQQDSLIAEYVHSGNREVHIESIDYTTNTFTSTNHGLVNGDRLGINYRSTSIHMGFANLIPIVNMVQNGLAVIEVTENTFKLSTSLNGESISLVNEPTVDLTKFWFEVVTQRNVVFQNLDLIEGIVEIEGIVCGFPRYLSIPNINLLGRQGYRWYSYDTQAYDYGYLIFQPGYSLGGKYVFEISLNEKQELLYIERNATILKFSNTLNSLVFEKSSATTLSHAVGYKIIDGFALQNEFVMLNGTTIKVFKK